MKKLLTPICMFLFFSVSAQVTKDDVNLPCISMYGKDKRDLMQEYMKFDDSTKATAFWKLYDEYEAERKKLGTNFVAFYRIMLIITKILMTRKPMNWLPVVQPITSLTKIYTADTIKK